MAAESPAYYSLLLPLLLVVVPALYLVGVFRSRRRSAGRQRFPPGPWALPVIGHLHHLAGSSVPPHHAMRDLARRHGPLMLLRFCQLPVLVASSPDAAREIMKTHDVAFASRPLSPTMQLFLRGSEGLVFAPYGDGWRQLRKICTLELLSNRRVHSFRAVRAEVLGRLLRSVASSASASASVNLTRGLASFVADSSVQAMIGRLRSDDRDTLFTLLREGFKIVPGMTLPDLFPSSRLAMLLSRVPARIDHRNKRMAAFMDSVIQQHRDKKRSAACADGGEEQAEDLLDVLLRLQDDMGSQYPLTTENIKLVIIVSSLPILFSVYQLPSPGQESSIERRQPLSFACMQDMISASSETTSTTLVWAMAELLRKAAAMRKAQDEVRRQLDGHSRVTEDGLADLHYLRLVIKETLRLHPPVKQRRPPRRNYTRHPPAPPPPVMLIRECGPRQQVLGFDVPQGAMVLVNAWAMGRDPAHWDSAGEFLPERFESSGTPDFKGVDFEFLPFGAGRRICPGVSFGLVHLELALAALLFHFDWKLPDGMVPEELDMTEEAGLTTRRRAELVVFAVPHVPLPIDQ
uniref:Cytochrome P450 71D7 n=1 Tax=Aegilops tauschii TaxID=37682 RepID=N1QV71_AEGTA